MAYYGTAAGKNALKKSLLNLGKYEGDPYRTRGQVPTASALYQARQLMATQPVTAPNTLEYEPLAILLTGSVANSFLVGDGGLGLQRGDRQLPERAVSRGYRQLPCRLCQGQAAAADGDAAPGRSFWKQLTPVYVVAMAGVDQTSLPETAHPRLCTRSS